MKRLISKILYKTAKYLLRFMLDMGITAPLVWVYSKAIKRVGPENDREGVYTLLAINPNRFVGDLEILAESGNYRVFKMPFDWQGRMLRLIWSDDMDFDSYFNPEGNDELTKAREKVREYLKMLIKPLFRKMRIDGVISAALNYKQDLDWGIAADELGYPYIVLHKECLVGSVTIRKNEFKKFNEMEKFRGSHIIVHNENMKKILVDSGFAPSEKVSSLGCLRMDDFVEKALDIKNRKMPERKMVVLFSFHYCAGVSGVHSYFGRDFGLIKFFEKIHAKFAETAIANPDVDFIIKTKWDEEWYDEVDYVLEKNGMKRKDISNLEVTAHKNPNELILDSTVVCTYASTTILEAGIAAKPVIIPFFEEAAVEEHQDNVTLFEHYDVFDIAKTPEEMREMIENKLKDPEVTPEKTEEYKDLFGRYISSMDADSVKKYTDCMDSIIKESESRRG